MNFREFFKEDFPNFPISSIQLKLENDICEVTENHLCMFRSCILLNFLLESRGESGGCQLSRQEEYRGQCGPGFSYQVCSLDGGTGKK